MHKHARSHSTLNVHIVYNIYIYIYFFFPLLCQIINGRYSHAPENNACAVLFCEVTLQLRYTPAVYPVGMEIVVILINPTITPRAAAGALVVHRVDDHIYDI